MAPRGRDEELIINDQPSDEDVQTQRTKRRKNKKLKVGDESGLTEEDRRALRREQRELAKTLQEGPLDEDEDFLPKAREKNNVLFESVRYTREAVLDAENLDMIAAKSVKEVDDKVQVPRYDEIRLINKLKSKCSAKSSHGHTFFDWKTLGAEAGICFNAVPSRVAFLVGPLENGRSITKKVRTVRQKKGTAPEDLGEEVRPEELATKKQKKDADQLSQAERNFNQMKKILEQKSKTAYEERKALWKSEYEGLDNNDPVRKQAQSDTEHHAHEIDAVKFLMNPKSFTQTVENIFNASFMVKRGDAKMKIRKSTSPLGDSNSNPLDVPKGWIFASTNTSQEKEDQDVGPPTQCVMSFTMADWRRLCESRNLEEGDLPHRKTKIVRQSQGLSQDA